MRIIMDSALQDAEDLNLTVKKKNDFGGALGMKKAGRTVAYSL